MNNPLVSICIAACNAGPYIKQTIVSLINQTYKNIEIIISDNASTDNTPEIAASLAQKDKRIKFFRNNKNIGAINNMNKAVDLASSEYIAIYHADDIYEPSIVESELKILLGNPGVGGVFVKLKQFFNQDTATAEGLEIYKELEKTPLYDPEKNCFEGKLDRFLPLFLKYNNFLACPSLMCRKSVYKRFGGYTNDYPCCADLELWLKILADDHKLIIINKYLIYYRRHKEQGFNACRNSPLLPESFRLLDDFLKDHSIRLNDTDSVNYAKNKSRGYLLAAENAYFKKLKSQYKKNIDMSRMEYVFTIMSREGLKQNFPDFYFGMVKIKRMLIKE